MKVAARPRWAGVLRAVREAAGVSQEGWAALLACGRSTVQRWERGEVAPDAVAEAALVELCRSRGLFRPYAHGPLAGTTFTAEFLQQVLAEGRLSLGLGVEGSPETDAAGAGPPHGAGVAEYRPPPDAVPSSAAQRSPPSNLPAPLTSLVGRGNEIAAVRDLLRRDDVRLVTLTGTGGTGKTRVGIAAAGELLDGMSDGVVFVPLAAITDRTHVIGAIAAALGMRETEGQVLLDSLTLYLHSKQMLLLLDNFEQVIEAAPDVTSLLRACPRLKALVTSRTPLRVSGEWDFPVSPLAPPPVRDAPRSEARRDLGAPDLLDDSPAVQLFVERSAAARAGFALTRDNAADVAEVCRRLDGLPLAIELAAAQSRYLSPAAMLERLDHRLRLLAGGARDLPERHQSLRAALDWSYDLLDPPSQTLFRRLSVFAGGWTMEAVEAVCGAEAASSPPTVLDVFRALTSLLDGNLVHQNGEPQLMMLETVREYAAEKLEDSGEAASVRTRHLRYYRRLAQEADRKLRGPEQLAWLARLEVEIDNFRAALTSSLEEPELHRDGLALASALTMFWWQRHLREGCSWLKRTLAGGTAEGTGLRALGLFMAGFLSYYSDGLNRALPFVQESVALCGALGLQPLRGMGLALTALEAASRNDLEAARVAADESVALLRQWGDAWSLSIVLF